jgi:FkbM family methyltransferase
MGVFSATPKGHSGFGYKPNLAVRLIRSIADIVIYSLGLNSNNRLSVEIQQKISPQITVDMEDGDSAVFRSGHGRLIWRAKTLFTEEKMIIDWLKSFSADDVFFDIGANVGIYTVYAAIKNKSLVTFSFEPELNNVQVLYENLYLNKLLERCTIIPLGVDSESKINTFFVRELTKGGAFNNVGGDPLYTIDKTNSFSMKTVCIDIDSFLKVYDMPKPTKVKIDVDGNEYRVLLGMKNTLEYINEIYIELDLSIEEHVEASNFLKERGFSIAKVENTGLAHNETMSNYLFVK